MKTFIPIAEPVFDGNELKYLTECITTGWISSVGKFVERFETEFAAYIGTRYGVAVHTGTHALHLALSARGIGQGDEVILPALTFAATANAVIYTGARPVLMDVDPETWNLAPELLEEKITTKTKAIIPVHLYGHPCDMDPIMKVAEEHNLFVIEDAAEAHGAEYKHQKVGGIGDVGCFSFFGNKIITTGEGGICLCKDADLVAKIEMLRDHGMRKDKKYWHDEVGFNYRMTNLQAAVGVAQLERIDWFVDRKRTIAAFYNEQLSDTDDLMLPSEQDWAKSSYWMYTILVKKESVIDRDQLIHALRADGIESRPIFYPLHKMPPYKQEGAFPNAEAISSSGLSLPSAATLTQDQIAYITASIKKHLR